MRTTMPRLPATPIVEARNVLGESVLWSADRQCVYWIDGVGTEIHQWEAQSRRHSVLKVPLDPPIGMIAATSEPNTFVISNTRGLALLNLGTLQLTHLADPEKSRGDIGYNDGKVDPRGRLWAGTFDVNETDPRGCLWLLENGASPRLMDSGMAVVNGPAFSPDGITVYVSDSVGRRILAYDFKEGRLRNRRVLVEFAVGDGLPDGLTVDAEGCIWCALWDGRKVMRLDPEGQRMLEVTLPAPRVTSVAFGGASLDTLFVTTARYALSPSDLAAYPAAGALFEIQTPFQGLAATTLQLPFRS